MAERIAKEILPSISRYIEASPANKLSFSKPCNCLKIRL